jgi:thiol-disulfide isomerase/thioredoxin
MPTRIWNLNEQNKDLEKHIIEFKEKMNEGIWFVKYYADWCGHCTNIKSTWKDLEKADEINNLDINIVEIEQSVFEVLKKNITQITGFPTIILYINGDEHYFNGIRNLESMISFLKDKLLVNPQSVKSKKKKKKSKKLSSKGKKLTPKKKVQVKEKKSLKGGTPDDPYDSVRDIGMYEDKSKEVVMAAVQKNGLALQYASDEMKNDKDVVTAAVQQNGLALEFASEKLKNDTDVVTAAVQQDGRAFRHASVRLKNDTKVMKAALASFDDRLAQ